MVGQALPRTLVETDESISAGLAKRLLAYATERLESAGFLPAVQEWDVEVETSDADLKPADRDYTVSFKNKEGGFIAVCGILTNHGWPTLDHGFDIGAE
jgi:hypothetical protein